MKVALTGGTGFIGSHVLAECRSTATCDGALPQRRPGRGRSRPGATPAVVDLFDGPAVVGGAERGGRRHPHRQPG